MNVPYIAIALPGVGIAILCVCVCVCSLPFIAGSTVTLVSTPTDPRRCEEEVIPDACAAKTTKASEGDTVGGSMG